MGWPTFRPTRLNRPRRKGRTMAPPCSMRLKYEPQRLVSAMGTTGTCRPSADRKSTRLNSSHLVISYAVFCLKKKPRVNRGRNGTELDMSCLCHDLIVQLVGYQG